MRILGWLAMALAVVVFVASLGLAAGVWVIKPQIQEPIHDLVTTADGGLAKGIALTDLVSGGLTAASSRVGDVKAKADAIATTSVVDLVAATGLATAVSDFISGPYTTLRTAYASLRERVTNAAETLRALDRFIPAVSIPDTAGERLQAIDAKLVAIDAAVTSLGQAEADGTARPGIASRISEQAASARATLDSIEASVSDVGTRLQDAQGRLATARDRVDLYLFLGAGAGTIFFLYLAGLNILLFQQGRRWSRRRPVPATQPELPASPPEPPPVRPEPPVASA